MTVWHKTTSSHKSGFYRIFMGPYEWLVPVTSQAVSNLVSRPFDFVLESGIFDHSIPESLLTCKNQADHKVCHFSLYSSHSSGTGHTDTKLFL